MTLKTNKNGNVYNFHKCIHADTFISQPSHGSYRGVLNIESKARPDEFLVTYAEPLELEERPLKALETNKTKHICTHKTKTKKFM